MKRKRRLQLVVETRRRLTLGGSGREYAVPCGQCSAPLVFAEEAVAATGLSSRTIHRLVEAGEVHFAETPAGALLVCLDSLVSRAGEAEGETPPTEMRPR